MGYLVPQNSLLERGYGKDQKDRKASSGANRVKRKNVGAATSDVGPEGLHTISEARSVIFSKRTVSNHGNNRIRDD